jgi:hypothetical protein
VQLISRSQVPRTFGELCQETCSEPTVGAEILQGTIRNKEAIRNIMMKTHISRERLNSISIVPQRQEI